MGQCQSLLQTGPNDYWIDDVRSKYYNQWVQSEVNPKAHGYSNERMKRTDHLYKHGITVEYNMLQTKEHNTDGSVITIHVIRKPGVPTAGCIAFSEDELLTLLGWLNEEQRPLIVMGSESDLVSLVDTNTTDMDRYVWEKKAWSPAMEQ